MSNLHTDSFLRKEILDVLARLPLKQMRPKKKTRRKNGHRQELTRVMVQSISVGGKAIG